MRGAEVACLGNVGIRILAYACEMIEPGAMHLDAAHKSARDERQQRSMTTDRQGRSRGNAVDRPASQLAVPDLISDEEWSALVRALRLAPSEAKILGAALYDARECAVAERLRLKSDTVHSYCERLRRKLDVPSMAQAIAYAFAIYVLHRQADPIPSAGEGRR